MVMIYQNVVLTRHQLWLEFDSLGHAKRLLAIKKELDELILELDKVDKAQALRVKRCEGKVLLVDESRGRAEKKKSDASWAEYFECCENILKIARDL